MPQPSEGSRVLRTDPVLGIKFVTGGGPGDPRGGAVRGGVAMKGHSESFSDYIPTNKTVFQASLMAQ